MIDPKVKIHGKPTKIEADILGTLPAEYILALKVKMDEKQRLYEQLPQEISECKRIYEAALIFAPKNFDPSVKSSSTEQGVLFQPVAKKAKLGIEKQPRAERKSWATSVKNVLDSAGRGMNRKELFEAVRLNNPDLPVSAGEKGFYNAIAKVLERGNLVKHGDLLFSSQLVEDMKSRGEELPETPERRIRSGGSADFVLNALQSHPTGLTAPEIKKIVGDIPEAPKSIREHGQYIYNILATLMGSGAVVKKDGIYSVVTTSNVSK